MKLKSYLEKNNQSNVCKEKPLKLRVIKRHGTHGPQKLWSEANIENARGRTPKLRGSTECENLTIRNSEEQWQCKCNSECFIIKKKDLVCSLCNLENGGNYSWNSWAPKPLERNSHYRMWKDKPQKLRVVKRLGTDEQQKLWSKVNKEEARIQNPKLRGSTDSENVTIRNSGR